MKVLGYRITRIKEWMKVLKIEGVDVLQLVGMISKGIIVWVSRRTAKRDEVRSRIRACNRCVLYNKLTHACRGPGGFSHLGCGCYIPLKAKFSPPRDPCFLDEEHGGWRTSE